jgi:3-dehydroquinate synthase class II
MMIGLRIIPSNPAHYPFKAPNSQIQRLRKNCFIMASSSSSKIVWIKTSNKECLTASLECGLSNTILIDANDPAATSSLPLFRQLGRINIITAYPNGTLVNDSGATIGQTYRLSNPEDLASLQTSLIKSDSPATAATTGDIVVMDASDWQIIPAENLVAAYQSLPTTLLAVSKTAAESEVMLEALEIGTDGVVLETSNPEEIRALASFLDQKAAEKQEKLLFHVAKVTTVRPVGSGDRACVDLCSNMLPGEGMLVGSFAHGLFIVHSECEESGYINSRPFRVNAGPVHAYCQLPGDKTGYLAELKSGVEVLVVDAAGNTRRELIGRVKIERRPLVLVEATTEDGVEHSILLQNAETVKLIGPKGNRNGGDVNKGGSCDSRRNKTLNKALNIGGEAGKAKEWRTISVAEMVPGDEVYVLVQNAARHTGVSIEESITEK